MNFKKILFSVIFILSANLTFSQGATCSDADAACAGGGFIFENTSSGVTAEVGPDYDCLLTQPNPAWFFLQIDQGGTLEFEIEQNTSAAFTGTGLDVDYICYGPFAPGDDYCNGMLTIANKVDCSYSGAFVENLTIANAQPGEIYVMMITNFGGAAGWINLEQTNAGGGAGTGSTDCSIVNTIEVCEDDTYTLDVTDATATSYTWGFDDGTGVVTIPGATGATLTIPIDLDGDGNVDPTSGTYITTVITTAGTVTVNNNVTFGVIYNVGTDNAIEFCEADPTIQNLETILGGVDTGGVWNDDDGSGVNLIVPTAVDFSAIAPGVYHYTYGFAANAGCPAVSSTITVTISDYLFAGTDNVLVFCETEPIPQDLETLLGAHDVNGTWSDDDGSGVVLTNPTAIDFSAIIDGVYHFTYSFPGIGSCAPTSATITVTIDNIANAGVDNAIEFCEGETIPQDLFFALGTTADIGGVWTETGATISGVVLGTGTAVDFSAVIDGTYEFTYTFPASAGCQLVSSIITVTISNLEDAGLDGTLEFCEGELTPQDLFASLQGTPTIGGIWMDVNASPTGVNLTNGTSVDFSLLSSGVYNFNYTFASNGSCPALSTTIEVTITELFSAGISNIIDVCENDVTTQNLFNALGNTADTGGIWTDVSASGVDLTDINNVDFSTLPVGSYDYQYEFAAQGSCPVVNETITVVVNAIPTANQPVIGLINCDTDNDGFSDFMLSDADAIITGGVTGLTVLYYETYAESQLNLGAINDVSNPLGNYANLAAYSQTLYVNVYNAAGCYDSTTIQLTVLNAPETPEFLTYTECDYFGDASDGIIEFDLTSYETSDLYTTIVANGGVATDYTTTYYSGLLVDGSPDLATAITSPYVNTVNDQIIYAVVTSNLNIDSNNNGCTSMTAITLHVDTPPSLLGFLVEVAECDDDTDGFFAFDLTSYYTQITNDNLNDLTITFYDNGSVLTTPFTVDPTSLITNPTAFTNAAAGVSHEVYVQLVNNITGCTSVALLTLDVNPLPSPLPQIDIDNMSSCVNDGNGPGSLQEGYAIFDFTDQLAVIQGIEQGVSLTFHTSEADANADINEITDIANFYNTTSTTQTIWVRDENDVTGCYVLVHFDINVPVPNVSVSTTSDILCVDENGVPLTTTALPVISATTTSGLLADYTFQWYLNDVIIPGETNSTITVTQEGTYTVVMTDMQDVTTNHDDTLCINMDSTTITISAMPDDFEANVTTNAFAENQQILATATSSVPGVVFIYTLDGLEQNTTGIFDNVAPGSHIVTITDGKGCWSEDVAVFVIDYPKFFTPNGDGINDYWAINGQQGIPISQIFIFDRFGKLLKQLDPDSLGWDGSYNGNPMPATDYWFKIIYIEGPVGTATQKEFRAHFALKR